jgi:hypothetical protein
MRGLLYSEAENAYTTHFYVTSLNALELKATPFLTVALVYTENIATVTVSNSAAIIPAKFGLLTAVLMKTYFVSLTTLCIGQLTRSCGCPVGSQFF